MRTLIVLVALVLVSGCESVRRSERSDRRPREERVAAIAPPQGAGRGRTFGTTRWKHAGTVRCVAFTDDGRRAVSGGDDRTLRLFDLATGESVGAWPRVHSDSVTAVVVAGNLAITGARNGALAITDLSRPAPKDLDAYESLGSPVVALRAARDGRRVLSAHANGTLALVDAATRRVENIISSIDSEERDEWVTDAALSPDGRVVAAAFQDGRYAAWDAESGRLLRRFDRDHHGVRAIALTDDGRSVVTGGEQGRVVVRDLATGELVRSFLAHEGEVLALALHGERALTISWDYVARAWDLATGELVAELRDPDASPRGFVRDADAGAALAISRDGTRALVVGGDETLTLWDLASGRCLSRRDGHRDQVRALACDATLVLSGSDDRTIRAWDPASGRELGRLAGHLEGISALALAPGGRTLLSTSDDGTLRFWDLATGRARARLPAHEGRVRALALSPDGDLALTGGEDGALLLWDVSARRLLAELPRHEQGIGAVAISPDRTRVLSGSSDGLLRSFELANVLKKPRAFGDAHLDAITCVAFVGAAHALTGGQDGRVVAWELASGAHRTLVQPGPGVRALAVSPDGRLVAVATGDGTLSVVRMETGKELAARRLPDADFARAVAFAADGGTVYAGTARGLVLGIPVANLAAP